MIQPSQLNPHNNHFLLKLMLHIVPSESTLTADHNGTITFFDQTCTCVKVWATECDFLDFLSEN